MNRSLISIGSLGNGDVQMAVFRPGQSPDALSKPMIVGIPKRQARAIASRILHEIDFAEGKRGRRPSSPYITFAELLPCTPSEQETAELADDEPPAETCYLIRKGAYYYRPNACGYTTSKAEAGRYTLEDAIRYSHPNGPDGPRDGLSYELAPDPVQLPTIGAEADSAWTPIDQFDGPFGIGNTVLVAVTGGGKPSVVGEAYFDPKAYDGTWWWAGTTFSDYHSSPIDESMHGSVSHFMALPTAPEGGAA